MTDPKQTYIVNAYHITERKVAIEASSEEEAIRLVKEGEGHCYDSEPMHDVFRPKWNARHPLPGENTR